MARFGSREICDVVLKDIATGKPVLYLESLKVSNMDTTAETVYARGGKGNPKLIGWEADKEVTFNMEDALISPEGFAVLGGNAVVTGAVKAHKKEVLTVSAGLTVTTAETVDTTKPYFVLKTTNGTDIGTEIEDPSVLAKVITLTGVTAGDRVIVDYYYESVATAKTLKVSSDKFGGFYRLEASTVWRRESDGKDLPALFTMPKIKVNSGFTITMEASGDPSTFNFQCDVFKDDASTDMVIIDILED